MSFRRSWIRWGGVGAAFFAFGLLSCKEAVMEPLTVAAVEVAGGGVNLRLGQTVQLTPTLKSAKGYVLPKVGISWSSSDAAKAAISPTGQVTAQARGPVTLTASAGGVSGTAAVTVIGVQSISLAPETLSVIVTQTRAMTATTVLDPGVTVTPTWRSLDTTIARVGTDGRVTATSITGIARIEVTAEDKKDTAVVRVVPVPVVSVVVSPDTATRTVGQTIQLTATPKDSIGGTLTGRVTTWTSSDTVRASVSGSGLVTVKAAGTATISATIEGKTGSAGLTLKVPVASVTVAQSSCTGSGSFSNGSGRLFTTETCEYGATVRDASGNTLIDRIVSWSTSDTTIAKIDGAPFTHPDTKVSTVRLLPRRGGMVTLSAAVEGTISLASISVIVPVAAVEIVPATLTLAIGATGQLSAKITDKDGETLIGRSINWTSSDTLKVSVSNSGMVTARQAGAAKITATSDGVTGSADVLVVAQTLQFSWTELVSSILPPESPLGFDGIDKDNIWIPCGFRCLYFFNGTQAIQQPISFGTNIYAVHARTKEDVYFSGKGGVNFGQLLRYSNGELSQVYVGSQELFDIWFYGELNGFSCGDGEMLHFRAGQPPSSIPTGLAIQWNSPDRFMGAWASGPTDAYCVGFAGAFHYDGTSVRKVLNGQITSVSGTAANNVWVVGRAGVAYRFNGSSWTAVDMSQGNMDLHAVVVSGDQNVFVLGSTAVFELVGSSWKKHTLPTGYQTVASELPVGIWLQDPNLLLIQTRRISDNRGVVLRAIR